MLDCDIYVFMFQEDHTAGIYGPFYPGDVTVFTRQADSKWRLDNYGRAKSIDKDSFLKILSEEHATSMVKALLKDSQYKRIV